MREINDEKQICEIGKALSSETRLNIIKMLTKTRKMNLNSIAESLSLTNGAITAHIKILHDAGIIEIENKAGKRGLQKRCFLKEDAFYINFESSYSNENSYDIDIPVGSYSEHHILPTCGIAGNDYVIGEVDDPRYFDDPKRMNAAILWFTKGYLVYRIPNYLKPSQRIEQIQISFEISSEAPGVCNDWPSDINFYLNDYFLGRWTSPGDFGDVKGKYTPNWWYSHWNQYGLLKILLINGKGSFIDGKKISDVNISMINMTNKINLDFKFEVADMDGRFGGLTLFGKGFGNYNQNINVKVIYD